MTTDSTPRRSSQLRAVIDITASVAMLLAAMVILWGWVRQPAAPTGRGPISVPKDPVPIEGTPSVGDPNAPVVIIEFSDFECPFCAKFVKEIFPELKAKYIDTGEVQFVFRHLPLTAIHKRARRAAEAAECAATKGKFWEMHDRLFTDATKLADSDLGASAKAVGLDPDAYERCMTDHAAAIVEKDAELARRLGLGSTPVFLVGRRERDEVRVSVVVSGAKPLAEFDRVLAQLQ